MTLNLAVMISGSGSNLQAIIDACAKEGFPARIKLVIANRPDAYGLERAEKSGIRAVCIDHRKHTNRSEFEKEIQNELSKQPIDLVCLAGFMRILTADFIAQWPHKIINTHPSLLPKFGGEGMHGSHVHKAVLAAGEAQSGASIHYVIPAVDQGEIIVQRAVPVLEGDTIDTLSARVIAEEHIAYPQAIQKIAAALGKE